MIRPLYKEYYTEDRLAYLLALLCLCCAGRLAGSVTVFLVLAPNELTICSLAVHF